VDWWQSLVVAFVSGAVGVGIGAFLSSRQQRQERTRLNQAAAMITYFELAENTAYLDTAIKNAVSMPVRTTTWPETRGGSGA
jgi:hypothetical protein